MYKLNICTRPSFSYVSFLQPLLAEWGASVHLVGLLKVCTSSRVSHRCIPNMSAVFFPPFTVSICVWNILEEQEWEGWENRQRQLVLSCFSIKRECSATLSSLCIFSLLSMEEYTAQWFVEVTVLERRALMHILGTCKWGRAPKICTTSGHRCFPSIRFKVAGKKKDE